MSIQFLAALIFAIYLLLPGYLLLSAAQIQRNRFLLSYGVSISFLILSLASVLWLTDNFIHWIIFFHVGIVCLVIGVSWHANRRYKLKEREQARYKVQSKHPTIWCLLLILAFCLYHVKFGPYTEIPSDFWKHLARVGTEYASLESSNLGHSDLWTYFNSGSSLIYVIQALVSHLLATDPLDLVPAVTLITSSIYLASVYWLSFSLFSKFFHNRRLVLISASLATLLTLTSFGTATFSYVRYYAFFPTIFGFPLIYASIVVFLNYLERPNNRGWQLLLIPLFLLVMILIHSQEALLTILILAAIAFVRGLRTLSPASGLANVLIPRARISAQFFLGLGAVVVSYGLITQELAPWDHTRHVIDAGRFLPFLNNFPIDNPSFRLWDTLGLFGIIIYVWSACNWKTLRRFDYLTAGMLIPIFTNLNPLYATVFLHFGSPTGLWRTAYLAPLSIVGALFIVTSLSHNMYRAKIWGRIFGLTMIALLALSLMPWTIQGYYNRTSRIPSLASVHATSGSGLWGDLIRVIREIEKKRVVRRIVTDQVSTFILYSANRSEIRWWSYHEYFPKNRTTYKKDFLESDLTGTLMVINRRNGITTESAQHARHWPVSILDVAQHYPNDLDEFLEVHKDHFELLWTSDDIAVYQMTTFDE
jgi:hypothetical protein